MDVTLDPQHWDDLPDDAEAVVDAWLVVEGAHVDAGQVIARVTLAKSALDVDSPSAGILVRIVVPAGRSFPRGGSIATLRPD